jgi:hypothetical protein
MSDLAERTRQQITERLNELRPAVQEYKQLQAAAAALEIAGTPTLSAPALANSAAPKPRRRAARPKAGARQRKRAPLSANQRAIVAALEHGAHTMRELVVVTAMSDQTARNNLKGLVGRETVVKTERARKAAYALAVSGQ